VLRHERLEAAALPKPVASPSFREQPADPSESQPWYNTRREIFLQVPQATALLLGTPTVERYAPGSGRPYFIGGFRGILPTAAFEDNPCEGVIGADFAAHRPLTAPGVPAPKANSVSPSP